MQKGDKCNFSIHEHHLDDHRGKIHEIKTTSYGAHLGNDIVSTYCGLWSPFANDHFRIVPKTEPVTCKRCITGKQWEERHHPETDEDIDKLRRNLAITNENKE